MKTALYLIPVTLGDTPPADVLPQSVFRTIEFIDEFVVENVRSARRFLRKAGFSKDFNEVTFFEIGKHSNADELIAMLNLKNRLKPLGLLSEAGVPCIADPGSLVVEVCHALNIPVIPLVGPSSLMLALMASGFNGQNFAFHGYLPIDRDDLKKKLRQLESAVLNNHQTQIFIETPFRNNKLLESLLAGVSSQLKLCIATELTTTNESVITRTISHWKQQKPDLNKKPTVFLIYI
ncbi:MAG: SAM-dependent methyltransferase [Bacteroidales bacterium]|nr:SAM-dependent methyltransferase [Bacteroidales bacterium]